jgi:putative aldouronate transport system permease protein
MWNTFMPCILYIQSSVKFTLQVFVRLKVFAMESIQYGNNVEAGQAQAIADMGQFGSETLKMAVVSVTSIPIICVYPFFQKYFIKGITLGAVKG